MTTLNPVNHQEIEAKRHHSRLEVKFYDTYGKWPTKNELEQVKDYLGPVNLADIKEKI